MAGLNNRVSWIVLAAPAIALWLSACSDRGSKAPAASVTAPQQASVMAQGYVEPATEVRRLAFQFDGIITQLLVEAGQAVAPGEPLARQSRQVAVGKVYEARAAVVNAQARLSQVLAGSSPEEIQAARMAREAEFENYRYLARESGRYQQLLTNGAITEVEASRWASQASVSSRRVAAADATLERLIHIARTSDVAVAMSEVRLCESKVQSAEVEFEARTMRSPISGIVLEVLRRSGEASGPLTPDPVMLVADTSRLRVRAEIDETSAMAVATGLTARVVCPGNAGSVTGVVCAVRQSMGRKTVFARTARERRDLDTRDALIDLPEGTDLPIGLRVDVEICPMF